MAIPVVWGATYSTESHCCALHVEVVVIFTVDKQIIRYWIAIGSCITIAHLNRTVANIMIVDEN